MDGLSTRDPAAHASTAVTLALVALATGWIPAWRGAGGPDDGVCVGMSLVETLAG